jgi:arginine repressor
MAAELNAQSLRRDAIVRILRRSAIGRQAELVELLRGEGHDAT